MSLAAALDRLVPPRRIVPIWEEPRLSPDYEQWWLDELAHLDGMCPGLSRVRVGGLRVASCSVDWARAEAAAHVEVHKAARRGVAPDFNVLDHEQAPAYARPHWCPSCSEKIVEAIAKLPDLAAGLYAAGHDPEPMTLRVVRARVPLGSSRPVDFIGPTWPSWWREYLDCKHSLTVRLDPVDDPATQWPRIRRCPECEYTSTAAGMGRISAGAQTDGSKGKGTRAGASSVSPSWESVEEVVAWAGTTAARLSLRLHHSNRWARNTELSTLVHYLLEWSDRLLASDIAREVGAEVVRLVEKAGRGAGVDELVHRLPARCPHCKRRGLQRKDGEEKVSCRACGKSWDEDQYQWLVRLSLDKAKA